MNYVNWKIGGEAGFGIATVGVMMSKVAARSGIFAYNYMEYPSLIRGGHNVCEVRLSESEVFSQEKGVDILVCLNQETLNIHRSELKINSIVVFDPQKVKAEAANFPNSQLFPVPITEIIKKTNSSIIGQNMITLGISCAVLNLPLATLLSVINDNFIDKGSEIISKNQLLAQEGFNYTEEKFKKFKLKTAENNKLMAISGNEAIGLGAIASDCRFYCAYPMTPTSNILSFMAGIAEETGLVVKHAEDEISVINMAIGASFTGARSMIGTAGGGFSLMVEGLGLAGITETPLVIAMGQRPGPATGMPTWTSQGDLKFLINASQDEFLRIVLAPGDVTEAFELTVEAFNLADLYQTPVFILVDKYVCESIKNTPVFDLNKIQINRGKILKETNNNYRRYQKSEDGISPRVYPGVKGLTYLTNSYEHEDTGLSTEESSLRNMQVEKRNRKTLTYLSNMPSPAVYGEKDVDISVTAWGSSKGPILQALHDINFKVGGKTVNLLHLTHVWPLNTKAISNILGKNNKKVIFEGNSSGQLASIIREQTGITFDKTVLRYDGRPFYPEDIIKELETL